MSPTLPSFPFTKMHGAANDYVYVDLRAVAAEQGEAAAAMLRERAPEIATVVSDRRTGIGGDGLILIAEPDEATTAEARMVMFNADGSQAEMCGNGVRCVGKYVHDRWQSGTPDSVRIETPRGTLPIDIVAREGDRATQLRVNMETPVLRPSEVPTTLVGEPDQPVLEVAIDVDPAGCGVPADFRVFVTAVSMGNPHAVVFFDGDEAVLVTDQLVHTLGPRIEHYAAFPNRTNVEFVTVPDRSQFVQRTWERGSGETFACGTGACAVAVAGILTGRLDHRVVGHLLGGDLTLEWTGQSQDPVFMTGGAESVFEGRWPG